MICRMTPRSALKASGAPASTKMSATSAAPCLGAQLAPASTQMVMGTLSSPSMTVCTAPRRIRLAPISTLAASAPATAMSSAAVYVARMREKTTASPSAAR